MERVNPLLEINQVESNDGEVWLKGNFSLLNLNLSRRKQQKICLFSKTCSFCSLGNYLTIDTVKQFLLSVQQQSALTHFNEAFNLSTVTTTSLLDFSGLCRLELKGMIEISMKSVEYQTLETLLQQKNPSVRFQQIKDRETKEQLDVQLTQGSQQLQPTPPEKITVASEKTRGGSTTKATSSSTKTF